MVTFWEYMDKGGPVMWPILILSIIGFAVMIERAWVLRKARINVNEFLAKIRKALMVNRSLRDAVKICEQYQGPVASVMKAGLLKHGQPKDDVEKTIENAAMCERARAREVARDGDRPGQGGAPQLRGTYLTALSAACGGHRCFNRNAFPCGLILPQSEEMT